MITLVPFLPQDLNPWVSHRDFHKVLEMHSKALPRALYPAIGGSVISPWDSPKPGNPQGPQIRGLEVLPVGCPSVCSGNWLWSKPNFSWLPCCTCAPLIHSTNIYRRPMTRQTLSQELERQIKSSPWSPGDYIPMGVRPTANNQICNM